MGKHQLRREAGQALIMVAIALPVFSAVALVVVDGSLGFVGKRAMQNASDAAALAAAREVKDGLDPGCNAACLGIIQDKVAQIAATYSAENGGVSGGVTPGRLDPCTSASQSNCYTYPYPSDGGAGSPSRGKVEVRLQTTVGTFFTKIFGIAPGFLKPKARAVASASGSLTPHCSFPDQPGIVNPDQYAAQGCKVTGNPAGGIGAVAFTKSPDCAGDATSPPAGASIQWTGFESALKALMSNGGIDVSGNTNKHSDHVALGRYNESSPAVPHCVALWGSNTSPNFPDVHAITPFPDYPITPPNPAPPAGCTLIGSRSAVTFRARSSGVATLTTATPNGLSVGMAVSVAGVQNTFNGNNLVVTAVDSANNKFSYANPGGAVATTASGGTVTFGTPPFTVDAAWLSAHPTGGVFCVYGARTETLLIGQNGAVFNGYTFFAPSISITSNNQTFTNAPPASGQRPTVFDAYLGDFSINGQSNSVTGDVYAPTGNILLSGGGATTANGGQGFMESLKLIISGNFANYNGTGPTIFARCDYDPSIGTITTPDQYLAMGCVIQGNQSNSVTLDGLSMNE
jgi:hypothetical protein